MASVPFFKRTGFRLAIGVLIGLSATSAWVALGPTLVPFFDDWLDALGPYAEVGFAVIGGILLACCAPASLLYVTAGTIFGVFRGALLGSAAAVIGALLAFAIRRSASAWRGRSQRARSSIASNKR